MKEENKMKYDDLTIHQKISLKGEFETNPKLENYWAVMLLWGFKKAIEYFLNDDLSILDPFEDLKRQIDAI